MLNIYTRTLSGHRNSYLEFILNIFSSKQVNKLSLFFNKQTILFLMIEDSFLLYFIVTIWRSLLGWTTSGLLFRPKPVVNNPSFKLKIKRLALFLLKKLPKVKTILIVPDTTHPEFTSISDGWIYDFQFWDLSEKDYKNFLDLKTEKISNQLFNKILVQKNNRKVVGALGGQDKIKGFDNFAKTYTNNTEIQKKFLFAFAGKVKGFDNLVEPFEEKGGVAENKFVSNEDLITLYACSDLVWTLYAKEYDQASGIFGRAIQFGIPVIVRTNSLIHKICLMNNITHIACNENETDILSSLEIAGIDINKGRKLKEHFKDKSISQLKKILEINLGENN